MWETLNISTTSREQMLDITDLVLKVLSRNSLTTGICHLFVPHTTAGVTINEDADPDVKEDILATLSRLVPASGSYRHDEGNSDAHVKASLMGHHLTIPVIDGRPALGTWQGIFFCEFDGPRQRKIMIGFQAGTKP